MQVSKLTQTGYACPSEWVGTLEDGRSINVHFRWGLLEIGTGTDALEARTSREIVQAYGDPLDGLLEYKDLPTLAPQFRWPDEFRVKGCGA